MKDKINPEHYKSHPSGIECIKITQHLGFCLGNAIKYIWRADLKNDDGGIEDLKKAEWYIKNEINRRTNEDELPRDNYRQREVQIYDPSSDRLVTGILPKEV